MIFFSALAVVLFFFNNAYIGNNAYAGNDSLYLRVAGSGERPGASGGIGGLIPENEKSYEGINEPAIERDATEPREAWRVAIALSRVSGYTQYEIGGTFVENGVSSESHFPVSRLKFPLNFNLVGLRLEGRIGRRYTLFAEGAKDASNNLGKMEDSDFLPGGFVFIFSETDTELDARMLDAGMSLKIFKSSPGSLGMVLGYRLEDFSFKVKNLDQWAPLDPGQGHVKVQGLVGTYDVTYHIPYIGIAWQAFSGKYFKGSMSFDYSPLIFVRDRDDHILREILSYGKTDGSAYRAGLTLSFVPGESFFAILRVYRSRSKTKGADTSTVYGGADIGKTWKIDHETGSGKTVFSLLTGLRF